MGANLDYRAIPGLFASHLRRDAALYALVLVYTFAGLLYAESQGVSGLAVLEQYGNPWALNFGVTYPLIAVTSSCVYVVHRFDARRRLAFRQLLDVNRLSRFLAGEVLLFALVFFQGTFTAVKIGMARASGFQYDRALADIDQWLHFGHSPFELLYKLIGFDGVRHLLAINYEICWFIACFGMFFWMATSVKAERLRLHYMLSFVGSWVIIGNVIAGIFTSAGPAFYERVTGDAARYPDLAGFLAAGRGHFASVAEVQSYLWAAHESGKPGLGTGISAFPSMHVSLIFLTALFVNRYDRRFGAVAFAYVGVIACSSVLLGWHYAVDAYVAIILTALIYHGSSMVAAALEPGIGNRRHPGLRLAASDTCDTREPDRHLTSA